MWKTKLFRSQALMDKFIAKHGHEIQWETIYINNGFGIEYRPLRKIM